MENNDYTNILENCITTAKERQKSYGEATESMQRTCNILKAAFGIEMNTATLSLVMVAMKLSRERNQHKEDNIIDMVNYLCIYLKCKEKYDTK